MKAIFVLVTLVLADLPVHCTWDQVLGDWTFKINRNTFTADLHDPETYCGHDQPNRVQRVSLDTDFSFDSENESEVTFVAPNIAQSSQYGTGTWTMVYDEGFIVEFPKAVFFNYFMYVPSNFKHESHCDRTMIGWVRGSQPRVHSDWACFYGVKKTQIAKTVSSLNDNPVLQPKTISFLQKEPIYDEQGEFVELINDSQSSWKAGMSQRFSGKTLTSVNSAVGSKQSKSKVKVEAPVLLQTASQISETQAGQLNRKDPDSLTAFLNTPIEAIPTESLPKLWDWSDINGVNYVSAPREQGDCGSCYTISTVGMLESRLRIQTRNLDVDLLSEQYLVSCSFYTEGCEGGYPTLLNKFISEFYIVPQRCLEYEAADLSCILKCDEDSLKQKVTVGSFGYVGGYYGASNEENMMKEIRARGPIVGNFEPPYDFSYYQSGIYKRASLRQNASGISGIDMRDEGATWEKVDHSVLITGWGEEDGVKYWRILNSWGPAWGEEGYFRIQRGTDECSIESMGEFANPKYV